MKVYLLNHLQDITPQQLERDLQCLPQWRRDAALAYKHHVGRVQCAEAYLLLMQALCEGYGIEDEQTFDTGEHGKPSLHDHPEIHFNLSHCKKGVICVVDDAPVGCDIESIATKVDPQLCNYCMSEQETEQIMTAKEPTIEFARLWTMKEAVVKLTGEGLITPLREILDNIPGITIETHADEAHGYVYSIAQYKK